MFQLKGKTVISQLFKSLAEDTSAVLSTSGVPKLSLIVQNYSTGDFDINYA